MKKRRITAVKSEEWIIQALFQLMETKSFQNIKVTEIAQIADLDCRTFYRHFKTKEDVLKLYCETFIAELPPIIFEKGEPTLYTVTKSFFEFCERHMDFLLLLKKHDLTYFLLGILSNLRDIVVKEINPQILNNRYGNETPYVYSFVLGGYWNIMNTWLSFTPRMSADEITGIIVHTIFEKDST